MNIIVYNPSNIFARARLVYPRIFPKFLKPMDNKHNSLNLSAKICSDNCPWTYLFLEAYSFPPASLSENCSFLGTDNVRGQISKHIFMPNEGYCLYNLYIYIHFFFIPLTFFIIFYVFLVLVSCVWFLLSYFLYIVLSIWLLFHGHMA